MRFKAFVLFVYRDMDYSCFSGGGVPCRGNCRYCNVGEKVTCEAATYNLLYENKIADDFWGAQGRCSFKNDD